MERRISEASCLRNIERSFGKTKKKGWSGPGEIPSRTVKKKLIKKRESEKRKQNAMAWALAGHEA